MTRWRACAAALVIILAHPAVAQDKAPVADYALIGQAIDSGRLVQARAMLANQRLAEGNETSTEFEILGAQLALAERRDAQALAAFGDLKTRGVADCRVDAGLGVALVKHQRAREAVAYLDMATQACPERGDAWNALGVARDLTGDWKESESAYEMAFSLSDNKAGIMNNYGFSLLLQQRFAAATRLFAEALRADPGNERYANNADIARAMAGAPIARVSAAKSAVADDAEDWARRLNNAGYASLLAGRRDDAKAYFSRSLHASDTYSHVASANLAALTGDQ
ncbi:MAG: hypothetical protein JJE34_02775 [Alphaproteobacteria bacterium]|nr:hypothetical protein [Alphaproteobacteria bacterium]